jgi:hypothetical protein
VVEFMTLIHLRLVDALEATVPPESERAFRKRIDALNTAISDTPELLRAVLDCQEVLGEAEEAARETFDNAVQASGDDEEIECAVAMARASDRARAAEAEARRRWLSHQAAIDSELRGLGELIGASHSQRPPRSSSHRLLLPRSLRLGQAP